MASRQQTRRHFGIYILTRREELGLSLRQLEERTGISNSRLSRWERGLELPDRPERLVTLAAGLELNLADLYAYLNVPPLAEMPALPGYLHQRYQGLLSDEAQAQICEAAEQIARQHGATLTTLERPRQRPTQATAGVN